MRNFQVIVFIRTQTYEEIFKSALVYLYRINDDKTLKTSFPEGYSEPSQTSNKKLFAKFLIRSEYVSVF